MGFHLYINKDEGSIVAVTCTEWQTTIHVDAENVLFTARSIMGQCPPDGEATSRLVKSSLDPEPFLSVGIGSKGQPWHAAPIHIIVTERS